LHLILTIEGEQFLKSQVPGGFQQENINVNGISYNVYVGGSGPSILLLHGYTQTAAMWFRLMDRWKLKFKIIAPDLKGIGGSSIIDTGYEKKIIAQEIKAVLDQLGVNSVSIFGHDIGLMVAYAFAAQFPETTERLTLMDAFLPGIATGDEIYNSSSIWHFRFYGKYAEKLVSGRERILFDSLWDGFAAYPNRFTELERRYYTEQYSRPNRMSAGFEYFKAMPKDAQDNRVFAKSKLTMPVLSIGGEKSLAQATEAAVKAIAENSTSASISCCGHWLMEECPEQTIRVMESFLEPAVSRKAA
jgi:pimeloyl-ACP methyl ester carboxylesterase